MKEEREGNLSLFPLIAFIFTLGAPSTLQSVEAGMCPDLVFLLLLLFPDYYYYYYFNAHFKSDSPNSLIFLSVSLPGREPSAGSSKHTWKTWRSSMFLPNLVTQRGQKGEEKEDERDSRRDFKGSRRSAPARPPNPAFCLYKGSLAVVAFSHATAPLLFSPLPARFRLFIIC